MSTLEADGVLKPILLRSSTPAPNEKVLQYLEGMSREGDEPDDRPPRSIVDSDEYKSNPPNRNGVRSPIYSPAPRSKASDALHDFSNSPFTNGHNGHANDDGIDGDDADSNVQDGLRSEADDTALPLREPGPNDPPGPKYESYDSGPSFGNFGPLPAEDFSRASNNPYAHNSWNPNWTQIMNKHPSDIPWNQGTDNGTTLTAGGQQAYPAQRANIPTEEFGASPRQTTLNVGTESPMKSRLLDQFATPPKLGSRAQSRATNRDGGDRPFSPSARSRGATEKGTTYPPLPESAFGVNDTQYNNPASPKSRARSKAPSISPSDSPSQMKPNPISKTPPNGLSRSPPPGSPLSGTGHHSRPFSPYRHAPTTEDLLHAAVRGRALVIPEEEERELSVKQPSQMASPRSKAASQLASQVNGGKVSSHGSTPKQPSVAASRQSRPTPADHDSTPTPTRPHSPEGLDPEEARIVNEALAGRTPRTSYYAASLEPDVANHYHDAELCVLLNQESDTSQHDVVRKALRKAIRQRVKKLGMKYDTESIKQYKRSYHDHDPSIHMRPEYEDEPPKWASDIKRELVLMQQRIESLGPKIENLKGNHDQSFNAGASRFAYDGDDYTQTPQTQTVNIQTQPTGTVADSMYRSPDTEVVLDDDGNVREFDEMTETQHRPLTDGETRSPQRSLYGMSDNGRDDSPGQQYLEEELYKLRQKPQGSQSALSHKTWEIARNDDHDEYDDDDDRRGAPSGMPTIPDTNVEGYPDREGSSSPPLPALPAAENKEMAVHAQGPWNQLDYSAEAQQQLPPWQRIHGRLLSWAIIWPMSELEQALNSTTRGHQVDEVALSVWSTQTYKRYVRARLTDSPRGVVDRLFVPPNMADAISNAVFNGRHGDACGMLRDLWSPFGLEGMPRLLVVLAKHRSDPSHWVVHRFSLPDGALTTYDCYPERTLPDGRPLGWWFAIRIAWPNAMYPNPDHLMQKIVRLHRPLQLPIDNSVAAAGIWRNILMGSRAERSLDLERLRDLINTEVKNLKQRKQLGKLSIGVSRPAWEDMA